MDKTMESVKLMVAALVCLFVFSLGLQGRQVPYVLKADTMKSDTLRQDSLKADTLRTDSLKPKEEKKKEESEYEKLLKKGGTALSGLFTVRHIEDKYYFEVPDSMLGRLLLCVTRFTAVPQGFGQFAGEEVTHCTVYMEKRDSATMFLRQYVLSYLANDKDNIARTLEKSTVEIGRAHV